jgi:glutathione S-transferase
METIKLYGYSTSPFVRKIGCCLYYKNIPFEFVPVNPVYNQEIKFTKQTQVPVIQIGEEWRKDSTPLAMWMDELFPEKVLFGNNQEERERIINIDDWITDNMIHSGFRSIHSKKTSGNYRHFAWRLAAIVSSQTPLTDEIRNAWPELLKLAPFIKKIAKDKEAEDSEGNSNNQKDPISYMLENLDGGPYLAGLEQPSIADFSAYHQFVFNYMVGITQELPIAQEPVLNAWMNRVKEHLPENPMLVPDYIIVNKL